jgi:hypothetical protein
MVLIYLPFNIIKRYRIWPYGFESLTFTFDRLSFDFRFQMTHGTYYSAMYLTGICFCTISMYVLSVF